MKNHLWTNLAISLAVLTYASGIQTLSGDSAADNAQCLIVCAPHLLIE
jgi:hypothetical protein